jgi:hypothetical protein
LSLWNLKIMKDTLRLLSFHLRMLPYACCPALWQSLTHLGAVEGYIRASNRVNKSGSEPQLVCNPYRWQRKTCKPGSNPCLTTPYAISDPHGGRSGTRTCSTQTCCLDIFTARPSPLHVFHIYSTENIFRKKYKSAHSIHNLTALTLAWPPKPYNLTTPNPNPLSRRSALISTTQVNQLRTEASSSMPLTKN